jgi:hypothetical protein
VENRGEKSRLDKFTRAIRKSPADTKISLAPQDLSGKIAMISTVAASVAICDDVTAANTAAKCNDGGNFSRKM